MRRWHLVEGIDLWTSVNSFAGQHVTQVNHLWLGESALLKPASQSFETLNMLPLLYHCRECRPGKRLHRADHWWFRQLLAGNNQGRNWFRKEVRSEVELRDVCSARAFHDFSDLIAGICKVNLGENIPTTQSSH